MNTYIIKKGEQFSFNTGKLSNKIVNELRKRGKLEIKPFASRFIAEKDVKIIEPDRYTFYISN